MHPTASYSLPTLKNAHPLVALQACPVTFGRLWTLVRLNFATPDSGRLCHILLDLHVCISICSTCTFASCSATSCSTWFASISRPRTLDDLPHLALPHLARLCHILRDPGLWTTRFAGSHQHVCIVFDAHRVSRFRCATFGPAQLVLTHYVFLFACGIALVATCHIMPLHAAC